MSPPTAGRSRVPRIRILACAAIVLSLVAPVAGAAKPPPVEDAERVHPGVGARHSLDLRSPATIAVPGKGFSSKALDLERVQRSFDPDAPFIVGFLRGAPLPEADSEFHGGTVVRTDDRVSFAVVRVPLERLPLFLAALLADGEVRYFEQDLRLMRATYTPNDPKYSPDQYDLKPATTDTQTAWDVTRGSTSVKVCVIDTGILATHEDFSGATLYYWKDEVNGRTTEYDDNGHGTHVAGTIAAKINNGKGIAGMAQISLGNVKALDMFGSGSFADIASGVADCDTSGAHIISLSLGCNGKIGSSCDSKALHDAIKDAYNRGKLVVAAAGNDGPCSDCVSLPAAYPEAIAITCTDEGNGFCSFSSQGPEAFVAAPGNNIQSTYNDGGYRKLSGTSMSTPHVAGMAALMKSANPSWDRATLKDKIKTTATDLGTPNHDHKFGWGLINVKKGVGTGGDPTVPGAPTGLSASAGDARVSLSWTAPDDGGSPITDYKVYRGTSPGGEAYLAGTGGTNTSYVDKEVENGVTYYYQVSAVNAKGEGAKSSEVNAKPEKSPPGVFFKDDFEEGLAKWSVVRNGGAGSSTWQLETQRSRSATHGAQCGDGTSYEPSSDCDLITQAIDLSNAKTAHLSLYWYVNGENTGGVIYDYGVVYISKDDGATWTKAKDKVWSEAQWTNYTLDFSTYTGYVGAAKVKVKLKWISDSSIENAGMFVDDVKVWGAEKGDPTVPGAPTGLTATGGDAQVSLSWTAPDDGGSPITDYKVHRSTVSGGETYLASTGGTNTSYVDKEVTNGVTYYYKVSAVNAKGEGALSAEASATPSKAAEGDYFKDDFESGLSKWTVVRNGGTGTSTWALETKRSRSTSHGAQCGDGTTYKASSDCDLITQAIDLSNAKTAHLSLFWYVNGEKTGGVIYDYGVVYISKDDGATWTKAKDKVWSEAQWTNYTLDFSTYTGYVGAAKVKVKLKWISDSSIENAGMFVDDVKVWGARKGDPTVPGAPTGLTATGGNAQVSLSWTAPDDGGSPITDYKVYRSTVSGGETYLASTGGTNRSYVDKEVTNGVTYYYKVSAVNAKGEGALSAEASATPATTPGAPTGLTATGGVGQVSLSWTAPTDDGGAPITDYKVYRSTVSGGQTYLASTGGTNRSYVDKGVSGGTTYYYKVAAVNRVGTGGQSNEASATPTSSDTTFFTDDFENGGSKWSGYDYGWGSVWYLYDFSSTPSKYKSPTHAAQCGDGTSYEPDTDCGLRSDPIDLRNAKSAKLKFWHKVKGEKVGSTHYDYGIVWVTPNGGGTWCKLKNHVVDVLSWTEETVDLTTCSGVLGSSNVQVEFEFVSDGSVQNDGWFIDDVKVTGTT